MSTLEAYEDLAATVADLKLRVEALERELAAMKITVPPIPDGTSLPVGLHAKWDNGKYDEGDFA